MEKTRWNWNDREIIRYLGGKTKALPETVQVLLGECKAELEGAAAPKSVWREFPLAVQGTEIDLGCFKTESRNLARNLRDCDRVLLFGATLGAGADMLLGRYEKLQISKAVVLQAAAVAMLETYCDERMQQLKVQYQSEGRYLRPRFSPGYGDFSLECQRRLVPALDLNRRLGVSLTDGLLMLPSKSVTAVVGISTIPADCRVEGCEVCGKKDCLYRR